MSGQGAPDGVTSFPRVTRFEVIDHTTPDCGVVRPPGGARAVIAYGIAVSMSLQDDGRTLKVFLADLPQADGTRS